MLLENTETSQVDLIITLRYSDTQLVSMAVQDIPGERVVVFGVIPSRLLGASVKFTLETLHLTVRSMLRATLLRK